MRILFMGTPDYALFSLKALFESGEEIIGVVTQPDKPKGRGYALTPPPVKVYALEKNIPAQRTTAGGIHSLFHIPAKSISAFPPLPNIQMLKYATVPPI